jgi:hypothetical protein
MKKTDSSLPLKRRHQRKNDVESARKQYSTPKFICQMMVMLIVAVCHDEPERVPSDSNLDGLWKRDYNSEVRCKNNTLDIGGRVAGRIVAVKENWLPFFMKGSTIRRVVAAPLAHLAQRAVMTSGGQS